MSQTSKQPTAANVAASLQAPTPGIDALLSRLSSRLTQKIWLFGLGSFLGVSVAWLAFAFLADWALHVPGFVRWLHLAVLFVLPAWVLWRCLLRPLARRPDREQLALLVERSHPELSEMLVSAVQLSTRPNGAPELVSRVIADAETCSRDISLDPILDARGPHRRALLGGGLLLVALLFGIQNQTYSGIFFSRLFGLDVPWPQLTYLTLSIPIDTERATVDTYPDSIEVRAARGTDVPVVVRVDGVLPEEVFLHFEGGRAIPMTPAGNGVFRTLLRSVQTEVEFHATGGDDQDGLPRVRIVVLEPPDITALAVRVTPPAYTNMGATVFENRDIEALSGSHIEVCVLTAPPEASGQVQLLPADELVDLLPMTFFASDPESPAVVTGLGFELDLVDSLRYRFELRDASGLANPDPGLFAINLVPDRRPEVQIVAPGRSEIDTTARGLLPLVVRAEDDFGLESIRWELALAGASAANELVAAADLVPRELPRVTSERADSGAPRDSRYTRAWAAAGRIEIAELVSEELAVGAQFTLTALARDNRPALPGLGSSDLPSSGRAGGGAGESSDPGLGRAPELRVRIVTEEELLRRVQDRLVRVRSQVAELEELNRKRAQLTAELLATLESDDLGELGESELLAALTGARRVQGDAKSLARELASVAETVLYARLDEKADGLLGQLDAAMAEITDKRFHAEVWMDLSRAWKDGRLGTPAFAGQLIGLVDLALLVSESDAQGAAQALDRAVEADGISDVHAALSDAAASQAAAQAHIEDLLERLAEWDNFQSVLTLTRDILNRQKALEERTRRMARDK